MFFYINSNHFHINPFLKRQVPAGKIIIQSLYELNIYAHATKEHALVILYSHKLLAFNQITNVLNYNPLYED